MCGRASVAAREVTSCLEPGEACGTSEVCGES
jgi:hypothetical protein